jgi:hypothetical protein
VSATREKDRVDLKLKLFYGPPLMINNIKQNKIYKGTLGNLLALKNIFLVTSNDQQ